MTNNTQTGHDGFGAMYAINATDIPSFAHSLTSDDADAPTLECDACGREVDTYRGAHDEPDAMIREFLFHVAYDHGAPATVLEGTRTSSPGRGVRVSWRSGRGSCACVWIAAEGPYR